MPRGYDRRMLRMRGRYVALAVLAVAVVVLGALYVFPSDHYVYLPDKARAAAPLVKVPDDENQETENGIYMVDVIVRRASILERLVPGLFEGATLVPEERLNPLGVSDAARRESSLQDMTKSQQVAAAVALRELGYDVEAVPNGVLVSQISPDAPAAGEFEIGDVIVRVGGEDVRTTSALARYMRQNVEPGDTVDVTVRRGDGLEQLRVGTERSQGSDRPVFGILVEQEADITLPIDISIDAGNIGGPSAGLAFALDIVDEVGSDIDEGRKIVVTGAIALDGTVEPIGGIKQKTIGAREADADVFVVPEENAAEARQYAEDLRVVSVSTFDEALTALETAS
jgi:PDZ domain-containing protein